MADRLPPDDAPVLVCETTIGHFADGPAKREITTLARYKAKPESWEQPWEVVANCGGYECDQDDCNPEYWMSLPPVPNTGCEHLAGANHSRLPDSALMEYTWPQTTKDNTEGREWIHPTPPRYYLHLYPKAGSRHGKHLGKYAAKWVVIDRDSDFVCCGPYARKSDCVKAFFRTQPNVKGEPCRVEQPKDTKCK